MTDSLLTPWSRSRTRAAVVPVTSFGELAAPVGGATGSTGWALSCPWSAATLPAPPVLPLAGLPTLAPSLPVPRPAGDEAVPALA